MQHPSYQYYNSLFKGQRLPLAYIDLDMLDKNIKDIAGRAGKKTIRIASKSIRCTTIIKRILDADTVFKGIMAFTAEEALFLLNEGFDDILIGYPCVNEEQLEKIVLSTGEGNTIIPMVDTVVHLELLNKIAAKHDIIQPVCIDVDMSMALPGLLFGVQRSPVNSLDKFKSLIDPWQRYTHLRLEGIMGYEAQIAGVGDLDPSLGIKNKIIPYLKKMSIRELANRREACVNYAISQGHVVALVNGGGTGSMKSTRKEDCVTEITVGSGFYSPALFDYYSDFKYLPAAGYAVEIVRKPSKNIYTCLGGGYIASGGIGPNKQPVVYLPEGAKLTANEGAGEVQSPVEYTGKEHLNIGDTILFRHSKAGELCERFNDLSLVSKGHIISTVPTYRGMGKCFL